MSLFRPTPRRPSGSDRTRDLRFDEGPTSEDVAVARAQVFEAEARLAAVEIQLAKQALVAPRNGLISRKLVVPGELATPGAVPLSLIDLGNIKISKPEAVAESPGGIRMSAHALCQCDITVCPQEGLIYFERKRAGEEE